MRFLGLLHPTGRTGFDSWRKPAAPLPQPLLRKEATNDLEIPTKIDCNPNDPCFVLFFVIQPEAIGRGGGGGERGGEGELRGGGGYSREGSASDWLRASPNRASTGGSKVRFLKKEVTKISKR